MYAAYFGLDENPFSITPDPRYLFLGARHSDALAHLLYGIREGNGFIQLTGEVGTGKTTLTRSLLEELPDNIDTALVLNPIQTVPEFLRNICEELRIEVAADAGIQAMVDALNRHLLAAHAAGRRTILIIDEAQNLPRDLLEQVRLLTNLETTQTKLLQILLIGQPELRATLARSDLRQLAQRITARYHLDPLDRKEVREYVEHRLQVAGAAGKVFTRSALAALWQYSRGVPRLINILCDRALLAAFTRDERRVSAAMMRIAAREALGHAADSGAGRWALAAGLAATLVAASVFLYQEIRPKPEPKAGFSDWLLEHRAQSGSDQALNALFETWGAHYRRPAGPACEQAAQQDLACLYERTGWRDLLSLDRPVIITLQDPEGRKFQVLAERYDISNDELLIRAGDSTQRVKSSVIAGMWLGELLALWSPPGDLQAGALLAEGSQGPAVAWLRRQLGKLGYPAAAESGQAQVYGPELTEAVRRFQQAEALRVDGIAGARTLIRINSLTRSSAPQLATADGPGKKGS